MVVRLPDGQEAHVLTPLVALDDWGPVRVSILLSASTMAQWQANGRRRGSHVRVYDVNGQAWEISVERCNLPSCYCDAFAKAVF